MHTLIDEIIILALCVALLAGTLPSSLGVVALLSAIIFICICWLAPHKVQVFTLIISCLCPLVFSQFAPLLALIAYVSLHEHSWTLRLLWVASLITATIMGFTSLQALITTWLLCGVSTLLAIRDIRSNSELAGLKFAYDDIRERYLSQQNNAHTPSKPQLDCFSDLTKRELAVVRLVAQGKDNHEIAAELFLSEGTIRNHISSILAKQNLTNRTQLAIAYYQGLSEQSGNF